MLTYKGIQFDVIDGLSHSTGAAQSGQFGYLLDAVDSPSVGTENAYVDRAGLSMALWWTLISGDGPPGWHSTPRSRNLLKIPWVSNTTQGAIVDGGWNLLSKRSRYQDFEAFRQKNKSFKIAGIPFKDFFLSSTLVSESLPQITQALGKFAKYFRGRRLMTTSRGYVGGAPRDARPGDLIFVLPRCCDPIALRLMGEYFVVVGPCYVSGIMQGQALDMAAKGKLKLVDIKIQ